MAALEDVLLRLSEMVCELPLLKEMDINPLIFDENGALLPMREWWWNITSAAGYRYHKIKPASSGTKASPCAGTMRGV